MIKANYKKACEQYQSLSKEKNKKKWQHGCEWDKSTRRWETKACWVEKKMS